MGLSGPFAEAVDEIAITDEPTGAAVEATPASEVAAPAVADPAGRSRDESGKFAKQPKEDHSAVSAIKEPAVETPPVEAVAPVVETPPTPEQERNAALLDASVVKPYIPLGRDKSFFDGAIINEKTGDILIPAAQRDAFERLAGRGERYDQYRDDRATARRELDQIKAWNTEQSAALEKTFVGYFRSPEALQGLADAIQQFGAASVQREIGIRIGEENLKLQQKFGNPFEASAAAPASEEHATPPLDSDAAGEVFTDYLRDQLGKPEFKGMPRDLQEEVRRSLIEANLFFYDKNQGWGLNEESPQAKAIWKMAEQAMTRGTKAVKAESFNAQQAAKGAATPAPPAVGAKPKVGTVTKPSAPKNPLVNARTGKEYSNPWDAIMSAPTV